MELVEQKEEQLTPLASGLPRIGIRECVKMGDGSGLIPVLPLSVTPVINVGGIVKQGWPSNEMRHDGDKFSSTLSTTHTLSLSHTHIHTHRHSPRPNAELQEFTCGLLLHLALQCTCAVFQLLLMGLYVGEPIKKGKCR